MDLLINEKHLGLVALTILVIGLVFLIKRWPKDIHHTFSQHAATTKLSTIYYSALFAVTLPILAIFLFFWLVPTFGISPVFIVLVGLSLVCQYTCTLVPEVGYNIKRHQVLAGISGLLLLPSLILFITAPSVYIIDKIISAICMGVMVVIVLMVARQKIKYALILQSAYFTAFFIPILAISYI